MKILAGSYIIMIKTILCMVTKLGMVSLSILFMSFIDKHPSLWIHN